LKEIRRLGNGVHEERAHDVYELIVRVLGISHTNSEEEKAREVNDEGVRIPEVKT
jgi:hypothetical protein